MRPLRSFCIIFSFLQLGKPKTDKLWHVQVFIATLGLESSLKFCLFSSPIKELGKESGAAFPRTFFFYSILFKVYHCRKDWWRGTAYSLSLDGFENVDQLSLCASQQGWNVVIVGLCTLIKSFLLMQEEARKNWYSSTADEIMSGCE
jgi:hypothetical protein